MSEEFEKFFPKKDSPSFRGDGRKKEKVLASKDRLYEKLGEKRRKDLEFLQNKSPRWKKFFSSRNKKAVFRASKKVFLSSTDSENSELERKIDQLEKTSNGIRTTKKGIQEVKKTRSRVRNLQKRAQKVVSFGNQVRVTVTKIGTKLFTLFLAKSALLLLVISSLLFIVVSFLSILFGIFSTGITTKEEELTDAWNYLTKLDCELQQEIHSYKNSEDFTINTVKSNADRVEIKTNIDPVLAYFDVRYGKLPLGEEEKKSKKKYRELVDDLYGGLYAKEGDHSYRFQEMGNLIQVAPWKLAKKHVEQLNGYQELGQYHLHQVLENLYGEDKATPLRIRKRFGYFLEEGQMKNRESVLIDGAENQSVYAPMEGTLVRKDNQLTLTRGKTVVTLGGIKEAPFPERQEIPIKKKVFLGFVDNSDGVSVSFFKKGRVINPAFLMGRVSYLEATNFGFERGAGSFDLSLLKMIVKLRGGALAEYADKMIEESKKAGVSPFLFVAIVACESGWGTSPAILEHHNPSGQMIGGKILHYASLNEGIEATGRTLHNLVVEGRRHTVSALGQAYAPVGAKNDPLNMNFHWVPSVKKIIAQLGGDPEGSLLWEEAMGGLGGKLLEWMNSMHQKGVIYTQDGRRGNFPYFDCSAFVTAGMQSIGIPYACLGSTQTLLQWGREGKLAQISRSEVKAGDLFVWQAGQDSSGNNGHTGVFLDDGKTIIHCTSFANQGGNVVKTPFEGYYGVPNVGSLTFLRLK